MAGLRPNTLRKPAISSPIRGCPGFGARDNPGPVFDVGGACEAGDENPARDDAPAAVPVSRAAEMASSPLRISATPSRIQDCPTAGRVAMQVYVIRHYRPEDFKYHIAEAELPIMPITYSSDELEPALLATYPESGLSREDSA